MVIELLIVPPQCSATTFIKPILISRDSQQEDARVDFENAHVLARELAERPTRISGGLSRPADTSGCWLPAQT